MRRRGQDEEVRRRLGQFFTPTPVAELTAAAATNAVTRRVIDPTCGPGRMLWAAARARPRGAVRPVGIEVDPVLAALARVPPGVRPSTEVEVICGEAFSTVGGMGPTARLVPRSFDAVLGNPPYVRYQAIAALASRANPRVMRAATTAFADRPLSRRIDALLRACLLAPMLPSPRTATRSLAARLVELEERLADPSSITDPLARTWAELVRSYSGLSDLSLPTWLLAWVLARPDGRIAFVASESADRREYGRLLRYFQLRFLQPLLVVEPADASWFPGAQVPASLVVYRVRPEHELMIPLGDRRPDAFVIRVRLPPDPEFRRVGDLAARLRAGPLEHVDLSGFETDALPLRDLQAHLLARAPGARGRDEGWLERLERRERGQLSLIGSLAPPPDVARVVSKGPFTRLRDLDIEPHQGLRTGCNAFFYLRRGEHRTVAADPMFGCEPFDANAALFRPVVRRQRDVTDYAVDASMLPWVAFVAGAAACPEDLAALEDHPQRWRSAWADAGQRALPEDVARWIARAARTELTIRGRVTAIPRLSAVAPNARSPRARGRSIPPPPGWWYTLPLAPRHDAPVFLARITHDAPAPRLNDRERPALVDSNFVTFTLGREAPAATALLALLASNYVAACLESSATPMGGGALKVEAAHLRQLPIPVLGHEAWSELARLGDRLASRPAGSGPDTLAAIDRVLVSDDARARLVRIAEAHRRRRRARAR